MWNKLYSDLILLFFRICGHLLKISHTKPKVSLPVKSPTQNKLDIGIHVQNWWCGALICRGQSRKNDSNWRHLAAASLNFSVSGEGCPRKNADTAQDRNTSVNPSSPVIAAFKGTWTSTSWLHFSLLWLLHVMTVLNVGYTYWIKLCFF